MSDAPELEQLARDAGPGLRRLIHDLKQPLNLIRVTAQEVRLDVKKARLEVELLPERMLEIERAVDRAVEGLEQLMKLSGRGAPPETR